MRSIELKKLNWVMTANKKYNTMNTAHISMRDILYQGSQEGVGYCYFKLHPRM